MHTGITDMSTNIKSKDRVDSELNGAGVRIAIVSARFNDHVNLRLLEGVSRGLDAVKVAPGDVTHVWVAGAFELPLAAKAFAESGKVDAVICVGCVIRGETTHYEIVSEQCASGIQQAQLATGVPIIFAALTTENLEQALARSEGPGGHNVGEEGARTAVEMALLLRSLRQAA